MSTPRKLNMENRHQNERKGYKIILKIQRYQESNEFLQKCLNNQVNPQFTFFKKDLIEKFKWSKQEVKNRRTQITKETYITNTNTISNLESQLTQHIHLHYSHLSPLNIHRHISKLRKLAFTNSKSHRQTLLNKFSKLNANHNNPPHHTIQIINNTELQLPAEIIRILKFGASRSVGGSPRVEQISEKFDYFSETLKQYCQDKGHDKIFIDELLTLIKCQFHSLRKAHTNNRDSEILKKFLEENEEFVFLPVDKSDNLKFMKYNDYDRKLRDQLDSQNFEKIEKEFLEKDFKKFNNILEQIRPFLDKNMKAKIIPNHNSRQSFGLVKEHKVDKPLRLIISGSNSLTSNVEKDFLKPILNRMLSFCKFSIKSTEDVKNEILKLRSKFNKKEHSYFSLDVSKMYDSVDVDTVVKFIIEKIYLNPKFYFADLVKNKNEYPTQGTMTSLLKGCLKDFTGFISRIGEYKQKKGLNMGGSISPIIANIYCSLIENRIVSEMIRSEEVITYLRFADDVFVITKKSAKFKLFSKLNSKNKDYQFKIENAKNSELNFLDSTIFFNNKTNLLAMKHFQKKSKSDVLCNFEASTSPKSHLNNCIIGSVNRISQASTDEDNIKISIDKLKIKLRKNAYPENLIKNKIEQALKIDKREEAEYDKVFYLALDYTSKRCSAIQTEILGIIKKFIPKFKLVISWRAIRLNNIINPRLKVQRNFDNPVAAIYKFTCPCNATYIGETRRSIEKRISEHNRRSSTEKSEIYDHISTCEIYQNQLKQKHKYNLTPSKKFKFIMDKISIIKSRLFNTLTRRYVEGFYITLYSPTLNKQNKHRKIKFI